ncbi:MAG: paraquat-inducible protein A [Alteromonadaceae bacterium]|jgi:paraquat-inducible protein A
MKTARNNGYVLCHDCHSLNNNQDPHCYRCRGVLQSRINNSLGMAWIWLVTAALFIIPANIYPITVINRFGVLEPDTIMSGIVSLIESDMIPIAIIVFVASIVVPGIKVVGLFYIYISVHMKAPVSHRRITAMFHFIEWIGRWSMLDLFVISLMIALLDIGQMSVAAGPATMAFGLLVVSTMLSAQAFDTRLLWDSLWHKEPGAEQSDQEAPENKKG